MKKLIVSLILLCSLFSFPLYADDTPAVIPAEQYSATDFINPDPVTVPAQAEKVYNRLWLTRLIIEAPTLQKASITAEFLPYSGTDIKLDAEPIVKTIPDLWQLIMTNDKVAQAYGALIVAIKEATGL